MTGDKLAVGKTYKNKTWNYLAPCLRFFGNDFMSKFSKIRLFGIGLADGMCLAQHEGKCLYLMVDTKYQERFAEQFIEFCSLQDYFVRDYSPSKINNPRRHMIVLELPKRLHKTYDAFVAGKYSKMFTEKQVEKLFTNGERREFGKVLKKDMECLKTHVDNINKEFGTTLNYYECLHHDYDLPPQAHEELFHYTIDEDYVRNLFKEIEV